jgi:hypothetical protein
MKFEIGDKIETNDSNFGPEYGEIVNIDDKDYYVKWCEEPNDGKHHSYHFNIIDNNYVLDKQCERNKKLEEILEELPNDNTQR